MKLRRHSQGNFAHAESSRCNAAPHFMPQTDKTLRSHAVRTPV
ncbi:hypothetical protein RR11_3078 [Ruegeria sp. R11]|nr:hypothetical protein RR11_3078 [Ruegeria sp. R11]